MNEKVSVTAAQHFVAKEEEFHLGVLPTEQPHPKTVGLAEAAQAETRRAVCMIQQVDQDVLSAAERALSDPAFLKLESALVRALEEGRTVYLSGCGATGRVSLLLEAAWRRFWRRLRAEAPELDAAFPVAAERLHGLITGGDYALVRSVDGFEDYDSFGRRQIAEAGVAAGDVVVAITEGGETSSVIGTAWEGLRRGAQVFFICNNPAEILRRHVRRSRDILDDRRVTHLNLSSGPMAVAGSTRMQATTSEILVVGAAIEKAIHDGLARRVPGALGGRFGFASDSGVHVRQFAALLQELSSPESVDAVAGLAECEEAVYRAGGAVTYFGDEYLLDIFTDTTERAPTFMLPPFRKGDDSLSPRSWAFVKHLFFPTRDAWQAVYQRAPRCLPWTACTYEDLGASETMRRSPPQLGLDALMQFRIGNEADPTRYARAADTAVLVLAGQETAVGARILHAFESATQPYPARLALAVGPERAEVPAVRGSYHVAVRTVSSPLELWTHLAIKLTLNTLSTVTMARMGRLTSNWMVHVETTNKKLVDRGTRLVACLTGLGYDEACVALHKTMAELADWPAGRGEKPSPVALTVERVKLRRNK
jgi:N-acetylmuramic acid 6-phosphate etherase